MTVTPDTTPTNPLAELLAWLRYRMERAVKRDLSRGNDRPAQPVTGDSDAQSLSEVTGKQYLGGPES